ncbi:MAG: hypothetical protein NTY38_13775 [Acidobacteria bacterium]|nr:hypothetical protein [Acidobacteriota bacterium]
MSTPAQLHANQQNAARSTGPRTPEGKAASAANSTSHGLSGSFRLLPGEDIEQFRELLAAYENEFDPVGEHECFLVNQAAEARWKLLRIERLQSEAFEQILAAGDSGQSPDALILAALSQPNCVLHRLERYAAGAERTYLRCYRELTQLWRQRVKDEAAAMRARINRLMTEPLPTPRDPLRNEPNPTQTPYQPPPDFTERTARCQRDPETEPRT